MSRFLRACEMEDWQNTIQEIERERERRRQQYLSGNSLYQPRNNGSSVTQTNNPQAQSEHDYKPKQKRIG